MDIFGIGFGEMFFLVVIGLLVIGPEKLPDMAKKAGKAMAIVKAQTNEMKNMLSLDTPPSSLPGAFKSPALTRLSNLYEGKAVSDAPATVSSPSSSSSPSSPPSEPSVKGEDSVTNEA